jgi:superfamily II DNA or RNA helicase
MTVDIKPENRGLRDFPFEENYEANSDDLIARFLKPGLDRATHYDRAVGYFRSSVFQLITVAMSDFALRGGRIRLIASPSLTDDDYSIIKKRQLTLDDRVDNCLSSDINKLMQDDLGYTAIRLFATLLEHQIMDFRLTYRPDKKGFYHVKLGILRDGSDQVSWRDSVNETFQGWAGNEETIKPDCSWWDERALRSTEGDLDYFERTWAGRLPNYEVAALSEVSSALIREHAVPDPKQAIEEARLAYERNSDPDKRKRTRNRGSELSLHKYQADSVRKWWKEQRGIISYVTGGGKTYTALKIIQEWYEKSGRSVIVLVPSSLLAQQWQEELRQWVRTARILHVGGDDSSADWKEHLPSFTNRMGSTPTLVLGVLNSAAKEHFLNRANVGEHTLMVVDEVHKIGAPHFRKILGLEAGGRLGLSATPERFGDEEGTSAIFDYFGKKIPPPFTIKDGQEAGRLVPYSYFPEKVALTTDEFREYSKLSATIAKLTAIARRSKDKRDQDRQSLALIKRAKVLKGAENKVNFALQQINERYQDQDRWLVYCDDISQLEEVRRRLSNAGYSTYKYFADMAFSKPTTIEHFEHLGGILLSINCLDEGIDIPAITHALLLASSINPRQYIQRRGRVLRTCNGKIQAEIVDALVQPSGDDDQPTVVFDQDIRRADTFAKDATNGDIVRRMLGTLRPFSDPENGEWLSFEEDQLGEPEENAR